MYMCVCVCEWRKIRHPSLGGKDLKLSEEATINNFSYYKQQEVWKQDGYSQPDSGYRVECSSVDGHHCHQHTYQTERGKPVHLQVRGNTITPCIVAIATK